MLLLLRKLLQLTLISLHSADVKQVTHKHRSGDLRQ